MKHAIATILCVLTALPGLAQGYIQPLDNFHRYQITHQRSTLPNMYDARDYGWVLDARDQMINGTCWAFSCTTAWQIGLHKNGLETGYLTPHPLATCHQGFLLEHMTGGGNTRVANSMLARLEGVVLNEAVPYNSEDTECHTYTKENIPAYVLGWEYLPEADDIAIKKSIMANGAVCASIYYTPISYNNTTHIYEYQGTATPNHAITLIGWDDNKQAWLAQNSWGKSLYNGYLWISYKDLWVNKECTTYTNFTDVNSIDKVHHYTTVGTIASYGEGKGIVSDGIVEYDFTEGEQLVAIGTGINNPNTRVSFTVMDLNNLQILYTSDATTVALPGFYKHTLPSPLPVSGSLQIAVTYYSDTYDNIIPLEGSRPGHTSIVPKAGKQWIDFNESGNWRPIGNTINPYNLCIYAYTKNTATAIEEVEKTPIRIINGAQIAEETWNFARKIYVYGIDGKLHKIVQQNDNTLPSLVTGVYLLAVEKLDGSTYTEKIRIP